MSFKSGVKGRGSDRWWERRWWLWWGDTRRMRWTRRRVNRMSLTERRNKQWWFLVMYNVHWCIPLYRLRHQLYTKIHSRLHLFTVDFCDKSETIFILIHKSALNRR